MVVESAADLAAMFDTDDHAVEATYTPTGGSASTVQVILSQPHALEGLGGAGVRVAALQARIRGSQFDAVAGGGTLAVDGTTYTIVGQRLGVAGALYTLDLEA